MANQKLSDFTTVATGAAAGDLLLLENAATHKKITFANLTKDINFKIGTPVNNQIAVFVDDSTVEGISTFTYDQASGKFLLGTSTNGVDIRHLTTQTSIIVVNTTASQSATVQAIKGAGVSGDAILVAQVKNTSGGDAFIRFIEGTTTGPSYAFGYDNSASSIKLTFDSGSGSASPSTGTVFLEITAAGHLTLAPSGGRVSFYAGTPVVQASAMTTQLTEITHTSPGTPDFALQDMTNSSPYGFVTQDEANTLLSVVKNLQVRVRELEDMLDSTNGVGISA